MAKRHENALFIVDPGASNPSGILHSMLEACDEIRHEPGYQGTVSLYDDAALKLMCTQLAQLLGLPCIVDDFGRLWDACKEAAHD